MTTPDVRRSVEQLAQELYEQSDPAGIPWVKRGLAVREPWIRVAKDRVAGAAKLSES